MASEIQVKLNLRNNDTDSRQLLIQHKIYELIRNLEVYQDASGYIDISKLTNDDHYKIAFDFFATLGRLYVKMMQIKY
jgi:hypothetical protein